MKDYGLTRSTVAPQNIEIMQTKVFVASDVEEVTTSTDDGEITEYQFNLVEYDKDEYIRMMSETNSSLNDQITSTQLALCDVYEMLL